jgi:LmbE family N-acetylglucosaminyl deacetylase
MSETSPRLFVVSPHFDDAVFGCGALLATHPDAAVCTVFAGAPEHDMSTPWDKQSGFSGAHEAIRMRAAEDDRALEVLDAIPVRMPFLDAQYLNSPTVSTLAAALEEVIYGSTANTLLMPLGLFHSDHALVFAACCEVLPRLAHLSWFAYEEAIYRRLPGLVQERLADLLERGITATPAHPAHDHTLDDARQAFAKREAVLAYESQLRALPNGYDDVFAPERYWQLDAIRAHGKRAKKPAS